jgi:tetratricopeptide (TPR) repeat protein
MPSIDTLPRTEKRKVLDFVRSSNVLLNALDVKDYAKVTEQIKILKSTANDFDATKPEAAVATYSRASNMHIRLAKGYLAERDAEKARVEISRATEIWPQNPKLVEIDQMIDSGGIVIQLRNDFDRLFAEQNYREVFKRQHALAAAIQDDADRQAKFRQVLENITAIETAVGGAKRMSDINQDYAAWEELSEVHERFPDDPELNQFMTSLAPKVADFTIALSKAENHEELGNLGSALSWYYKARHLHPLSKNADEGIKRLVERALESNRTTGSL